MAVTPDSKILIANSRLNNRVYKFSLPDFKMLGEVEMICDRVGIIFGGELVNVGPLDTLLGHRLDSIEISFSGLPPGAPGFPAGPWLRPPVHTAGRSVVCVADEERANAVLRGLVAEGARVHAVAPLRRTLEEEFVQQIECFDLKRAEWHYTGKTSGRLDILPLKDAMHSSFDHR